MMNQQLLQMFEWSMMAGHDQFYEGSLVMPLPIDIRSALSPAQCKVSVYFINAFTICSQEV